MGLKFDLESEVAKTFDSRWNERDGTVVPDDQSVTLGNDAVKITGTVLYADMAASTKLVDSKKPWFAAEIYKTYLHCAAKIIRLEGGTITAYDGDRIMAVFIGDLKNTSAVRCALRINYAVGQIIMPAKRRKYPNDDYVLQQVIGIDTGTLFVAKTGVRGANDLVWVGRPANYAAKLTELPPDYPTYITGTVFDIMSAEVKISSNPPMWEERMWTNMNNMRIFRSNWHWSIP
jgi:class 3 adenylate cyclase